MKKVIALALTALMLCGLLAACNGNTPASGGTGGSTPAASTPDASGTGDPSAFGDTLTVVSSSKGSSFDYLKSYDGDWPLSYQIYDTLFRMDENGDPIPHVAESWTESDDCMTVTIKIRQGIKFHDGTPLDANAVAFNFDVNHEAMSWLDDLIPEWKVIDDYTFEVTKGHPYSPIFYSMIARPQLASPTAYEADPENPVGSGAYKFVSKGSDDVVHLEANEDYFLGAPYFKNLVFRPVMESATALIALQNGEVDAVMALTPSQLAMARDLDGITLQEESGWAQTMMVMANEPFEGNRALRQAVIHAVDPNKAALLNELPNAVMATDLFTERMMGSVYAGMVKPLAYDPEKAKELLKEANSTSDMVLPIRVTQQFAALAQSVQADLQAVGITAEIQQIDEATYSNSLSDGSFGLSFWEYGNDQSSVEDLLTYFKSDNFYGSYMEASPEYDAFVDSFSTFNTQEERKDAMKSALELQVEFANMAPLYESVFNIAYRDGLTGINPASVSTFRYYFGDVKPA